jgi:Tfp pilus assembly protein PilZ
MIGRSDEEHLHRAASDGRVLYSFNVKDFTVLHARWVSIGRRHSGIVLGFQQRYSIGEQLRRLLHILNRVPAADMLSRLEYLSTWGR